jgi:Tfp pilus assembly protein PilV
MGGLFYYDKRRAQPRFLKLILRAEGTSLIETVMALALVAICIGGILGVVVQSVELGQSRERAYIAMNLAKNRLERIRQIRRDQGYSSLATATETDTLIDSKGIADGGGDFIRTTAVEPDYAPNLTKVTVSVNYKKKGAFTGKAVELVTLVSPYS